jgi:hypothetical protein
MAWARPELSALKNAAGGLMRHVDCGKTCAQKRMLANESFGHSEVASV